MAQLPKAVVDAKRNVRNQLLPILAFGVIAAQVMGLELPTVIYVLLVGVVFMSYFPMNMTQHRMISTVITWSMLAGIFAILLFSIVSSFMSP